jgi:Rrf2 family nitric oxide-sensitive transcriptional repressor
MQLTKHTDYALRVLMWLAQRERATIREIAEGNRISENHLMKIVHGLAKLGYIETLRGKGGGLKLARSPREIGIGEVVRHTEQTLHAVECLADGYGGDCRYTRACRLKSILRDAQSAFLAKLDAYTLADLVPPRGGAQAIRLHL